MTQLTERLRDRFYKNEQHPYRIFEARVEESLSPDTVLLDAGCGRTAPVLAKYIGSARRLIGVELVEFVDVPHGIETYNSDLANIPIESGSVDLIISRSVFEHLQDPASVYREFSRVLKPGGRVIFLTANMWDYGTLVARLVPNRFHARIVKAVEGRPEEDTFPTAYKTNTPGQIRRLADNAGLYIEAIEYLNQYPNYFMFNGALFLLGMGYERITTRFEMLKYLRGWLLVTLSKPGAAAN